MIDAKEVIHAQVQVSAMGKTRWVRVNMTNGDVEIECANASGWTNQHGFTHRMLKNIKKSAGFYPY